MSPLTFRPRSSSGAASCSAASDSNPHSRSRHQPATAPPAAPGPSRELTHAAGMNVPLLGRLATPLAWTVVAATAWWPSPDVAAIRDDLAPWRS
jgi:hypothetical protein